MKAGVVIFPGSNCDQDLIQALRKHNSMEVVELWHKDTDLQGCTHIYIPGGFSYGDYLRSGAIAKLSTIMEKPLMRILQASSPDLDSVSKFYSGQLFKFVKSVLYIVPVNIFK